MGKIKELFQIMCETGLKLPFVHDPVSKKPSVTLLGLYLSFTVMLVSLILLHFSAKMIVATTTSIIVWILSYVMYRIRHLDKFKINLETKELEFDAEIIEELEKDNA